MRRTITAITIAALAFAGVTGTAHAAPKKFASCAALLADYPTGIAKSAAAAASSVATEHKRPKVNANLYKENNKRLDRNGDGVMCEQQA